MNAEKAALSYLHTFSDEVRDEADELRRGGAVKEIFGNFQSFQTRVRIGAQIFQCTFKFLDPKWVGTMNSKAETTAPLCASMQEYLHRAGELPATPTNDDEETIDDQVEKKLGRKLEVKETDFLGKIEGRYTKWLQKGSVIDHDMVRLHPRWPVEGFDALSLWPANEPPEDVFEFWNYCAYALVKKNLSWPPFMHGITDLDATRLRFSAWEREAELIRWRERTARAVFDEVAAPVQRVSLRLQVTPREARPQVRRGGDDSPWRPLDFVSLREEDERGVLEFDAVSALIWAQIRDHWKYAERQDLRLDLEENRRLLGRLLTQSSLARQLVSIDDEPLDCLPGRLGWTAVEPGAEGEPYLLQLVTGDGQSVAHALTVLPGRETMYLSDDVVFRGPRPWLPGAELEPRHELPAEIVETSQGVDFLVRLGVVLPESLAARVVGAPMNAVVILRLTDKKFSTDSEYLFAEVTATDPTGVRREGLRGSDWEIEVEPQAERGQIVRYDCALLRRFPALLEPLGLSWDGVNRRFKSKLTKAFPEKFFAWVNALPEGVSTEMDQTLASVMADPLKASVKFDVKPAAEKGAIDWFDLKVVLEIPGADLSNDDLRALVEARGGFVRLSDGLWHRLDMNLPEGEAAAVAELGLDLFDLSGERHRLHVLQLSSPAARDIFDVDTWNRLCDRASALKLSVRPAPPANLQATLRPYQIEGFHFLAYLAINRFGGILADDMGLGKTVQALCWLLWLRQKAAEEAGVVSPDGEAAAAMASLVVGEDVGPSLVEAEVLGALPVAEGDGERRLPASLVVAPKSVLDVWAGECAKFAPHLRVQVIRSKEELDMGRFERHEIDVLVLNYAQLRVNHEKLKTLRWLTMILDEGQQVKNPDSQASRAARDMQSEQRLVLTGTPIENRLLDVWSLMAFAMPGVLGNRKYFTDRFDRRKDQEAHVRLGARLRPFLLRRTKGQVALDLPPRTEEDVLCKLEPEQEELYEAELARIQSVLLGFKSDDALRKNSFVVLQGLMRLRQICCHPALIDSKHAAAESSKMSALFYLLDQLRDAGHKVLVFSQFTSMLALIQERLVKEERPYFLLTGQTNNRQEVVAGFQESPDPAVFLLSLKAGGSGLNLTAASYVVLYDPWWNPAVEAQAIDRTHRIGQTHPVIAYRLLARNTIEEKIRVLQQQKSELVTGVLGEESFTKNLSLSDMQFLFDRDEEA
jgi:superfamily II DNA or RNA helicase